MWNVAIIMCGSECRESTFRCSEVSGGLRLAVGGAEGGAHSVLAKPLYLIGWV